MTKIAEDALSYAFQIKRDSANDSSTTIFPLFGDRILAAVPPLGDGLDVLDCNIER